MSSYLQRHCISFSNLIVIFFVNFWWHNMVVVVVKFCLIVFLLYEFDIVMHCNFYFYTYFTFTF